MSAELIIVQCDASAQLKPEYHELQQQQAEKHSHAEHDEINNEWTAVPGRAQRLR
jgi:hypothetical protein